MFFINLLLLNTYCSQENHAFKNKVELIMTWFPMLFTRIKWWLFTRIFFLIYSTLNSVTTLALNYLDGPWLDASTSFTLQCELNLYEVKFGFQLWLWISLNILKTSRPRLFVKLQRFKKDFKKAWPQCGPQEPTTS